MWRAILLGKLSISILASLIVGAVCISQPSRDETGVIDTWKWIGLGVFFFLLALGQIASIYFMTKRKK